MTDSSYFVDHKRGEINELKGLLRNVKIDRDRTQKREVIKKVIAYMTLGIDVSKLFSDMIMATNTSDLVQKKMVYLYLCTYAQQKPELSILAINTLQKDGRDDDPMVRGLALRSLCSLRLPDLAEYVITPIRKGLQDVSSYVRKTAVIGCAKLFRVSPESLQDSDLVDVLYDMIKDTDSLVVTNVIHTLNEVLGDEGGMAVNKSIVMHLLGRIKEFNEWGQCAVLEVVCKYKPNDEATVFRIMNVLNDRLKHANSAVVMGTVKVFLHLTATMPDVYRRVFESVREPMLTLMNSQTFEISYPVLSHCCLLVSQMPDIFEDSYKQFFCRYNDPPSVKTVKLNTLVELATESNASDILDELSEYVTDVNSSIARLAIRCIGKVCVKIESCVDKGIKHLLGFLGLSMEYVSAETITVMKNLLRKYPARYSDVIPALTSHIKQVEEPSGKVSVIWMIGEYGEEDTLKDAPYILETFIDNFEEESSHEVRMELLTATVKLFFKRPPEVQKMLGRLLKDAIAETSQIDVRDRALLYYRLLKYDIHECARIVNCPKIVVDAFVELEDSHSKARLFEEFNSLSVLYDKPSEMFIENKDYLAEDNEEDDEDDDDEDDDGDRDRSGSTNSGSAARGGSAKVHAGPSRGTGPIVRGRGKVGNEAKQSPDTQDDLLNMGSSTPSKSALKLDPSAKVGAQTFQAKWGSLPAKVEQMQLKNVKSAQAFEKALHGASFKTMASGTVKQETKFYFYGKEVSSNSLSFVEVLINLTSGQVKCTFKCENQETAPQIVSMFRSAVASLLK